MIAHDHRIAENTANDRQRLYGNTFQRSGDRRRSWPILRFGDSSEPAIVSDHMETKLREKQSSHVQNAGIQKTKKSISCMYYPEVLTFCSLSNFYHL